MTTTTLDFQGVKARTDILDVARRYATVDRRESSTEYSGPCPVCGGRDRFHINERLQLAACRHCHGMEKWLDVIDLVAWLENVGKGDALRILDDGRPVGPVTHRPQPQRAAQPSRALAFDSEAWTVKARAAFRRLLADNPTDDALTVFDYLQGRGFHYDTIKRWGVGVWRDRYHGDRRPNAGLGVLIPWFDDKGVYCVNRRWLQPPEGVPKSMAMGDLAGRLHGGHLLAERDRLLIVEGELNAMSVWQAAGGWLDVLTVGSESQGLPDGFAQAARAYKSVGVWMDKPKHAKRLMRLSGATVGMRSPVIDGREWDANDLLRAGVLGDVLHDAFGVPLPAPTFWQALQAEHYDGKV